MKIFKYTVFLLLIVFIGAAIYIAVQPNYFEVQRSRTMNVPVSMIYENVIDFKTWETWSSWIEEKPETQITYAELSKGVGGSYSWIDDDGEGNMKTLSAAPYDSIVQELQFQDYEPSAVIWKFIPTDDGKTEVVWSMKGEKVPFMFKTIAAISGGFDTMIGPDFERGLEKMDSILIESMKRYDIKVVGVTEYGGGFYLYKTTNATNANISQKMAEQYGGIMQYVMQNQIAMNGMPFTIYHEMNNDEGNVVMSNGLPVSQKIEVSADSDILCGYQPKMKVLKTTLTGNYTNLQYAWEEAMKYVTEHNLEVSDEKPFEIYSNDPGSFPNPADWRTDLFIPLKE